ncbi:trimeric intracellular cation channel family protein [Photobacterium sp. BZF1]|uniref:trimeric intracellular cation channel family protein n=1 Tax=Photobacterium sp. BZF1 TaxID=1904457 RepID=UPI001653A95F|nr:trimeric intracellular cation channel family protein [Photobacterium sp. BZF1]MBC7006570.1 trimeric intracellular cation channel family protein [Photobacterium sp. BZF1]
MDHTAILIEIISVLGTAAFAISAVLAAEKKEIDLFAVMVLGMITAVGGGTIRDCLLDVPIFWAQDLSYIWIALASSIIGYVCYGMLKKRWINRCYLYIDTFAIAMFGIQGTNKAWELGFGLPVAPVLLGVITAVGGGIIRDVLLQRPTLLFSKNLYAIPVTFGCMLHSTVLMLSPEHSNLSAIISITMIIYIRHLSIKEKVSVPKWAQLGYRIQRHNHHQGNE